MIHDSSQTVFQFLREKDGVVSAQTLCRAQQSVSEKTNREKKKKKVFSERDECAGKRRIRRVKAWQVNDVFLNRNVAALNRHVAPNGRLPSGPEAGLASANQITNILINSASGVKHAAEMRDACFLLFFFHPSFLPYCFFFFPPPGG